MGQVIGNYHPPDQETTGNAWSESTRIEIPENCAADVLLNVLAISTTGVKALWYASFPIIRNTGDAAVDTALIDVISVKKDLGAALWDVDLLEDGSEIIVRVKGGTGVTVYWAINGLIYGALKP